MNFYYISLPCLNLHLFLLDQISLPQVSNDEVRSNSLKRKHQSLCPSSFSDFFSNSLFTVLAIFYMYFLAPSPFKFQG